MMPQKDLDLNRERENRVMTLQWLISPVKVVPRPRMLPSPVEKWYREIKIKFDKLHQEYCLSSGKQPRLTDPTESPPHASCMSNRAGHFNFSDFKLINAL